MVLTAVAMFGMSTLDTGTGSLTMSIWFALLGQGLAPVMVGATWVIVGNAPMELSGVAGGLQQASMQIGGSLGTAVLGAVMASKVPGDLPGNWTAAGFRHSAPSAADQAAEAVQVGVAPIVPDTPADIAAKITAVAQDTFISGMGLACLVAAVCLGELKNRPGSAPAWPASTGAAPVRTSPAAGHLLAPVCLFGPRAGNRSRRRPDRRTPEEGR